MRRRLPACLGFTGLAVWFLADGAGVRAAASAALDLCVRSVIPSLFPFLVVSSALVSLGLGDLISPWLAGLMEPLFRVGGAGSAALVLGLVGGYPVGARTAAELYREGLLTREEAERLLSFCNNSNPVFLISVLGSGVFGSVRTGVWLWLIHVLSALLTGLAFRGTGHAPPRRKVTRRPPFRAVRAVPALVGAVRSALTGILSVCAFVVFFYVLAAPLSAIGGRTGALLTGLAELFSLTPLLTPDRFGFILAAGASGWGGACVLCQTLAALEGSGLRRRNCLTGKAVQGLISLALAAVLAGHALG